MSAGCQKQTFALWHQSTRISHLFAATGTSVVSNSVPTAFFQLLAPLSMFPIIEETNGRQRERADDLESRRRVGRLAWPLFATVLLIILGPTIRQFLKEAKTLSFGGAGFEASASRDDVAAAAALGAAVQQKTSGAERLKELPDIAPLIEKTSSPPRRRKLQQSAVLWVDDRPENKRLLASTSIWQTILGRPCGNCRVRNTVL